MGCALYWKKLQGGFFLACVIVLWVGSAVLTQRIFTSDDTHFSKPLFLTYYSTSFFVIYLAPLALRLLLASCRRRCKSRRK